MLTSATAVVSAEETVAEVTFEGSLPQYFLASAYLLDMYDYSPLCAAYETPMYTREMQALLASTVADYDADRVLNLDSSGQTNFAVYAEDTLLIEETEGVNTVAGIDEETDTYIFENADETITSLQVGDVFSYAYGEEEILIVKVASIAVDGTTVTITGGEVEMEEVFSHVKIETVNDTQDVTVDETLMDEGVTYDGQYGNTYNQGRALSWDGEESMKTGMGFSISKKVPTNQGSGIDGVEAEVTVSGSVKFNLELTLSYYVSAKRQFLQYTVNTGVTTGIKVTGEVMINMLRLGTWEVSPVLGLYIRMKPYVQLRFTGEMTFDVSYHSTTGFKVEHTKNGFTYKDLSTTPKLDAAFSFEGVVFFGVDLHPEIVIIDDNVAEADLEALIGLEIKSARTIASTDVPDPNAQEIHNCNRCYDGDVSLVLKVEIKVQFLKLEKLKLVATLAERTSKIGDYYYSADHREFGWKDCPYKSYLVTAMLSDPIISDKSGVEVTAYMLEERTEISMGKTGKSGLVTAYLKGGTYVIQAKIGETEYREAMTLDQPCKITLGKAGSNISSGNGGAFVQGNIDVSDYQTYDFGTPVEFGKCGDNVTWSYYSGGVVLITGKGNMWDMERYQSPLYALFRHGDDKLNVYVDKGVTGIGDYAFADYYNPIHVYLSEDVADISGTAFLGCNAIIEEIDPDNPVYTAKEDGKILIENKQTLVYACREFSGDENNSYAIPAGVTEIGAYAFYNCYKLKKLVIPATVSQIGTYAFHGASIHAVLDGNNPVFYKDASGVMYNNKKELIWADRELSGNYTIPQGTTKISPQAFYYCKAVESVTIPDSVTSIGDGAFIECSVTSLTIPYSVTQIGKKAFSGVYGTVFVDAHNTVYAHDADGKVLIKNETEVVWASGSLSETYIIPDGVKKIGESAFEGSRVPAVVFPSSLLLIDDYAFQGCNQLATASIPGSVGSIGTNAFAGCSSLSAVDISDGVIEIGNGAFMSCFSLSSLSIPGSVRTIGNDAFSACSEISYLILSEGLKSIGDEAFSGIGIKRVTIPNSVTDLGAYAFYNCKNLTAVTIGSGVRKMGEYIFAECKTLTTANLTDGVQEIAMGMFSSCPIAEITIPASVTAIGDYAFYATKLKTVTLPANVTKIGNHAFDWSLLETITIPNGVTGIGDGAFTRCFYLTQITIPNSVTVIGERAFENCPKLASVTLGSGVKEIGEYCFSECGQLTDIHLPAGITTITPGMFYKCYALVDVNIPDNVTTIDFEAFSYCRLTNGITIGSNVTFIGYGAFLYSSLKDVYYSGTQAQWERIDIEGNNDVLHNATLHCSQDPESSETITNEAPVFYAVWDGEYGKEENSSVKTASFTGLVPGGNYVLLSLVSMEAEDLLRMDNLLYITQGVAGEDGTLFFRYIDRSSESITYVIACGPSHRNLKDAVITFPQMYELDGEQVVDPTVIYDGKTLTEGKDYVLLGTVYVTGAGSYQCTIRGINDYTGSVVCTYTVEAHGHVFEGHVSNGDATCTADGTKTGKCIHCEETETITDAGSKLPHNWDDGVVTTQPTDKQQGIRTFTCTACSATRTETIPAIGHTHSYSAAVTAPTCTEKGYTTHTCSCGESYRDTYVDATGHTYGSWVVTRAATGAESGIETRTCGCGAEETREIPALTNPFEDVAREKFYYEPVLWAYHGEITTGKDATHFNPSGSCTRSQVVTFLWRAAGKPEPASSENPFPDVPEGKFYTKAVLWAVEQGITAGYKDGTFGPNDACTRGQIVTFLWRYFQQPEPTSLNNPFPDVADSKFYYKAVLWAVEQGVTGGFKDGTFGPNKTCTRDQIVTFLYRAMVQ